MRFYLVIFVICLSTSLFSIDIIINSASLQPGSDCLSGIDPTYDLTISNAIDDGDVIFTGQDVFAGLLRDGDCTVLGWWIESATNGNYINTIPGIYDGITTFPPDTRPFTISFHDVTSSSIQLTDILNTPQVVSLVFDPSATHPNCAALTDIGTPNCPFAMVQIVPTLGEWGLISLALTLMIFSVVGIRQYSTIPVKR